MLFDFQVGVDRNCRQKPQIDDENLESLWLEVACPEDGEGRGVRALRQRGNPFSYLRLKGYS